MGKRFTTESVIMLIGLRRQRISASKKTLLAATMGSRNFRIKTPAPGLRGKEEEDENKSGRVNGNERRIAARF